MLNNLEITKPCETTIIAKEKQGDEHGWIMQRIDGLWEGVMNEHPILQDTAEKGVQAMKELYKLYKKNGEKRLPGLKIETAIKFYEDLIKSNKATLLELSIYPERFDNEGRKLVEEDLEENEKQLLKLKGENNG